MKHKRQADSRRDLSIWKLMHEGSASDQQAFLAGLFDELCEIDFTQFKDSPDFVSPRLPYIRRLAFWVGEYENGDFDRLYDSSRALAYELLYRAMQFQPVATNTPKTPENG